MGHEIPNKHTIFQFQCVVKKFLRDNKDNGKRWISLTLLLLGRALQAWRPAGF